METLRAFIIVSVFLVKLAGVGIFLVGALTTWRWLNDTVAPRLAVAFGKDEDEDDPFA